MNIEDENLSIVIAEVEKNESIRKTCKIGLCRVWSSRVMDLLHSVAEYYGINLTVEAKEVDIESNLSHTFLEILYRGNVYYWDGIGIGNHGAYFGLAEEAPSYLLHSRTDMINFYKR